MLQFGVFLARIELAGVSFWLCGRSGCVFKSALKQSILKKYFEKNVLKCLQNRAQRIRVQTPEFRAQF